MSEVAVAKAQQDSEEMTQDRANEIMMQYKQMRSNVTQYANKIAEMDGERNEHQLVLNTIKDLDPTRRCFRLVGGVLVERTVKEVRPAVETNLEKIVSMIAKLTEAMKACSKEADAFQAQYSIGLSQDQQRQMNQENEAKNKKSAPTDSGVLVE